MANHIANNLPNNTMTNNVVKHEKNVNIDRFKLGLHENDSDHCRSSPMLSGACALPEEQNRYESHFYALWASEAMHEANLYFGRIVCLTNFNFQDRYKKCTFLELPIYQNIG